MFSNKNIHEILDQCITDILSGRKTIEECLQQYPNNEDLLVSLLPIAMKIQSTKELSLAQTESIPARNRLIYQLSRHSKEQKVNHKLLNIHRRKRLAWSILLFTILFIISFSTFEIAYAMNKVLPGHGMYPVKLFVESTRLKIASSKLDEIGLRIAFANNRISEIEQLFLSGKFEKTNDGFRDYDYHITFIMDFLSSVDPSNQGEKEIFEIVNQMIPIHLSFLEGVDAWVPYKYRDGISTSMRLVRNCYQRVLELSDSFTEAEKSSPDSDVYRILRTPLVLPQELITGAKETQIIPRLTSMPAKIEDYAPTLHDNEVPLFEVIKKNVATLWPFIFQRPTNIPTPNRTPRPPVRVGTRIPATLEPTLRPQLEPFR